jgi:uncharacterized protein
MRTRIGIIGDTHGVVHAELAELFRGVDRILHTGDVGGAAVLDALAAIAPVIGVRGNYDTEAEVRERLLPDPSTITLAGLPVLLTHRLVILEWTTHRDLIAATIAQGPQPPRLFIFGHTHAPVLEELHGIFFINPGYSGPDPLEGPPTAIILEIDDGAISGEMKRLRDSNHG